jgi:hypothetical protein
MSEYRFSTYTTDSDPAVRDAVDSIRAARQRLEVEIGALILKKLTAFQDQTGVMVDGVSVSLMESHSVGGKEPRIADVSARVSLRI